MSDLDEQLRLYFDATTDPVDVEVIVAASDGRDRGADNTEIDALIVVRDVPTRSVRWRPLLLVAAVTVAVLGVAGVLAVRDDRSPTIESQSSSVRDGGLEWKIGAVPNSNPDEFFTISSDGTRLYWIGDRISTSLDGVTWEAIEYTNGAPGIVGGPWVPSVWGGQLVRSDLSPPFGSSGGPSDSVIVEIVEIDGTVSRSTLVPDLSVGPTTVAELQSTSTVIGPRGLVTTARVSIQDYEPLLRDVLGAEVDSVTSVSLDRQVANATLVAELDGRTERIVLADHDTNERAAEVAGSGLAAWHSSVGETWTPVPRMGPFAVGPGATIQVTPTEDGFFAITNFGPRGLQPHGWFSPDGLGWSDVSGEPVCCRSALAWDGGALLAGDDPGLQAADARTISDLPGSETHPVTSNHRSVGAGGAGIAYFTDLDPPVDDSFEIVYSPDGGSWHRQSLPDEIGSLYCCFFDNFGVVVGADSVMVLSESDGELQLWVGTPTTREGS